MMKKTIVNFNFYFQEPADVAPKCMYFDVIGESEKRASLIRFATSNYLIDSGKSKAIYIENIKGIDKSEPLLLSIKYDRNSIIKIWMETQDEVTMWYDVLKTLRERVSEKTIYHKVPAGDDVYIPGK